MSNNGDVYKSHIHITTAIGKYKILEPKENFSIKNYYNGRF